MNCGIRMLNRALHGAAWLATALAWPIVAAAAISADGSDEVQVVQLFDTAREVRAQVPPFDFAFDGDVDEWRRRPPSLIL